ncbi:MAG: reductive dehalogenase domain-containing protein [Burkholderiales bacterium]
MSRIDISKATRPTRARVGGTDQDRAERFRSRFPPAAKRSFYIRNKILLPNREPPVNPERTEITDVASITAEIKKLARDMGADAVGVAEYDQRFAFTQAGEPGDSFVIVFGIGMSFDTMADIGPRSQDEVHRVYYRLDDIGVRLAQQIAAYGYPAAMQPNEGDVPLPAMAWLAGLGELGKHGSLISPELGSSFRLGAVTTRMPLEADGPKDFGFDEVCTRCGVCTRFCPGDAIKPEKQTINGILRWHVDTPACEPYFHKLYGCKICLMVCPLNSRGIFGENFKLAARVLVRAKDAKGMLELIEEKNEMHYEDFGEGGVPK